MNSSVYDIIVVGGGHAGIEASLVSARMGCRTLLVTHDIHEIGRMPCNPAIGGLGKGHLVREIDALGGEMARAIDATGIQFRILNMKKGPAVRAPRAQADKANYQRYMMNTVLDAPGLKVRAAEVDGILVEKNGGSQPRIMGVRLCGGEEVSGHSVILSSGTFLRGLMHVGDRKTSGGREGAASSEGMSAELARLGFQLVRLKTGTPPRLSRGSINTTHLEVQTGDERPRPFSWRTDSFHPRQLDCHITYTNQATHRLIEQNLDRSPLYRGIIEGRGPRYCPSIEDKVVRFAAKEHHLIFLEPEGWESDEIYVNGLSTSLPADVQDGMIRSIPGLQEAEILRYGYAVEYDSIPSYQVGRALESKLVDGLFLAGQIVGTSGYEEAAAQGLMAGINASLQLKNQPPLILERSEAYIGVLVDDLVTKQITEPYRMFTSRAEHRLSLRCDNAESRLLPHARRLNLLQKDEWELLQERVDKVQEVWQCLRQTVLPAPGKAERMPAAELLRRPEMKLETLFTLEQGGRELWQAVDRLLSGGMIEQKNGCRARAVLDQVENEIKYEGYITKQQRLIKGQAHLDRLEIPSGLDYHAIKALSVESREKLARMRPASIGQASRIDGVRAGDLAVLTVVIQKMSATGKTRVAENNETQSKSTDSLTNPDPGSVTGDHE